MAVRVSAQGVGDVERDLGRVESAGARAEKSLGGSLKSIGGGLQSAGKQMTTFVSLPLAGVGIGIAKLAGDSEAATSRMQNNFGTEFGKMTGFLKEFQKEAPASMTELKTAAAGTQGALTTLGVKTGKANKMTKEAMDVANNLAVTMNIPLKDAIDAVQSGYAGNTDSLRNMNYNMNQSMIDAEALKLGLIKEGESADGAARAQAVHSLVLKQSSGIMNAAQKQSGTFNFQMRRLWASVQDAGVALGEKLLPVLTPVANWMGNLAQRVGKLSPTMSVVILAVGAFAAALGPLLLIVGTAVSALGSLVLATGAAGVGGALVVAAGAIGAFLVAAAPFIAVATAIAVGAIAIYRNWSRIAPVFARLRAVVGVAIGFVRTKINEFRLAWFSATRGIQTQSSVILAVARIIRVALGAALRFAKTQAQVFGRWWAQNLPLMQRTAQVVMGVIQRVFQGAFNRLKLIVTTVGRIISALWGRNLRQMLFIARSVWDIIKSVIQTAIRNVLNVIKLVMQIITGDWRGAWQTIKNIARDNWNNIKTIIKAALNIIKNIVKIAMNNIRGIWEAALRKIRQWAEGWGRKIRDIFQGLANFARGLWRRAWDNIRQTWENQTRRVREWVSGWRDNLKNIMGDLRDAIWGAMKSIGKALWKPIQDGWSKAKEIWNSIIDAIAGVADKFGLDKIKKSLNGAKFGGGGGGGNAPASPATERMARGGLIHRRDGGIAKRSTYLPPTEYGEAGEEGYSRLDKYTPESMEAARAIMRSPNAPPEYLPRSAAKSNPYRGMSRGGLIEMAMGGQLGPQAMVDAVTKRWPSVELVNRHAEYMPADKAARSMDFFVAPGGTAAQGSDRKMGDEIASFISPPSAELAVWYDQMNYGSGWEPIQGAVGIGNENTLQHRDHVHGTAHPGEGFKGGLGSGLMSAITNPVATFWNKTIQPLADKFTGALGKGNIINQLLAGAGKKLVDGLREKVVGEGGGESTGYKGGGDVMSWIKQGLPIGGVFDSSKSVLNKMHSRAMQESGGDPKAQNNWDINAMNGNPSKGLFQLIATTADAYLNGPGQKLGPFAQNWSDPVWSTAIASRYMQDRYGGPVGSTGVGYDTGGLVKKEHQAILHPNELALPLNHPRTAPLVQSIAGTDRLEKELQETRRVLNETLVRQERQMVKVKEWARAQEAATRKAIGSGRADSELGNYMLKALD